MKYYCAVAILTLAISLSGCIRTRTADDTTSPLITMIVQRGSGNPIYRSDDERTAQDNCIRIPQFPATLSVIVSDNIGVRWVAIQALSGSIVTSETTTAPPAPELTFSVDTFSPTQDIMRVSLAPPAPDSARSAVVVNLVLDGPDSNAVLISAADHSGNSARIEQVDVYPANNQIFICRGDQL